MSKKIGYYTFVDARRPDGIRIVELKGDLEGMRVELKKMGFKRHNYDDLRKILKDNEMIQIGDIEKIGHKVNRYCNNHVKIDPDDEYWSNEAPEKSITMSLEEHEVIHMNDAITEATVPEEGLVEDIDQTDEQDTDQDDGPIHVENSRVYSDKSDRSIYELERRWKRGDLNLNPEFQRDYVWDNKKASLLVESVLLEIPIPIIYLAEEADGIYTLIDGQQRLRSFFRYINNESKLRKLRVLTDLEGMLFKDLDKETQTKIEDATIRIIEIRKETDPDVKFEIFERLNVGSVKLNDQELRNCIYRGKYNNLLKELSEDKDLLYILRLDEPQNRMQQRELVLRYLTFYNQTYLKYKQPMKQFLNNELENNKHISDDELMQLRQSFKNAISLTRTVFGKNGFRRFVQGNQRDKNGTWEKRINMGLYDVVMYGFSTYKKNQIILYSDTIREELIHLMTSDPNFINSISGTGTTNTQKVRLRFKIWEEALQKIVGTLNNEPRLFSLDFKRKLYERDPTCAVCGQRIHDIDDASVDHIEQYWRGGKTIPENARLTHRYCNLARSKYD